MRAWLMLALALVVSAGALALPAIAHAEPPDAHNALAPPATNAPVNAPASASVPESPTRRPSGARVVIDLTPATGVPAWLARSFELAIARELSGFERMTPVEKDPLIAASCGAAVACRLRAFRKAEIDVVLFGEVRDREIAYELYQTWTPARLATGTIDLHRGQTLITLKHATRAAFHPVLKHGGLLDQRPYAYELAARPAGTVEIDDIGLADAPARWRAIELWLALGAVGGLALPLLLLAIRRQLRAIPRLRSTRRLAILAAALALVVVALDPRTLVEIAEAWPWLLTSAGGLAWGALLVSYSRVVFPPLAGFARVAPEDVVRILASWVMACFERFLFVAICHVPVMFAAIWIGDSLVLPGRWVLFFVAPTLALWGRLWLATWVECLACLLDRRLVDGPATVDNPWSREIADYLRGYVRRTGWDLDPDLLASVVFLPGRPEAGVIGVTAYGGGPTHVRIVVETPLLELALGKLVEERRDDKPAARFVDWTTAAVVPRGEPQPRADKREIARTPAFVDELRSHKRAGHSFPGAPRRSLGQAATLLGYVTPTPGQVVPLISDSPRDLAVVRELLSEHYLWYAPDPDDEYDASDPTDKDLLFGALACELGAAARGETVLATLRAALGRHAARLSSTYQERIADSYVALNYGRHHLIQYLYYQWSQDPDPLTTRARPAELARTARRILRHVPLEPQRRELARYRSIRARLVWLSKFFAEPIADRAGARWRWLVLAAITAAVVAGGGIAVTRAVRYHPVYVERIGSQERAFTESRARAAQAGSAAPESTLSPVSPSEKGQPSDANSP